MRAERNVIGTRRLSCVVSLKVVVCRTQGGIEEAREKKENQQHAREAGAPLLDAHLTVATETAARNENNYIRIYLPTTTGPT